MIVADDDNLDIAAEFGFETVEQSNEHLGRKFNDGIERAFSEGADVVVLIGSDDWLHVSAFDRMPADYCEPRWPSDDEPVVVMSSGPEVVAGTEIALVDLVDGRLRRCRSRGRYGTIPWLINRKALERCGGRPLPDHQGKGIDGRLAVGLNRPRFVFHDPHPLARVDFKSDTNLNSFDVISGAIGYGDVETDPWPLLAELYPEPLVGMAREVFACV